VGKSHGVTRSGYRYGIVSAQELVERAGGYFVQQCPEKNCWLLVQGGDQAMAEHRKTVHGGRGDGRRRIDIDPGF